MSESGLGPRRFPMMPKVFIIILNWNGKDDTLTCLSSIQKLDYLDYHVIVVDNGSMYDSVAAIRNSYPSASWLTIIENGENLGYTGANNVGVRYAMNEGARHVWILNNHTIVEPDSLGKLIRIAEENPSKL